MLKNKIQKNAYYDSATLMLLTSKLAPLVGGSKNCAVMMASEMNKNIMRGSGLLSAEGEAAAPNDLIFAVRADDEATIEEAFAKAAELLSAKDAAKKGNISGQKNYSSTAEALADYPNAELAVVSLPGTLAHIEVKRLLKAGVNVLLFSDNVSLEQEIALKDLAVEKGLLMMGPDCGTAVINGVGLGFANKLTSDSVGIVAASGTGLQEVMCLLSNAGAGISQAIGTGGRDLKEAVGGKMVLQGLRMLEEDPETEVILIVSKPPAAAVVEKLSAQIKTMKKPVLACLLGDTSNLLADSGALSAPNLTALAELTLDFLAKRKGTKPLTLPKRKDIKEIVAQGKNKLQKEQKYLRGLYCGGTLAYEAQLLISEKLAIPYANAPLHKDHALKDDTTSKEHTILDLGDDQFTVGRPHPMIEPSLRGERLLSEALDPETAILLLDVELGYGSHPEAATILAQEVKEAKDALKAAGREVLFFATLCGTYQDYQGYDLQKEILESAGITVFNSNAEMTETAIAVLKS